MSFRDKAIWELYPETHSISDEPVGVLDKNNNKIKLDESAISIKVAELQAEYDANQYQRDRADSYPSWQEQMDLIYHSGVEGLKAELKKTKDKYPKG
tara:strand:- start:108 stop:398 length:291 start_codon:yes stop_codon:yes gene_type:complete